MLSTKLRLFPDHRGGAASSARGEAPFYQRRGLQPVQCPPIYGPSLSWRSGNSENSKANPINSVKSACGIWEKFVRWSREK